MRKIEARLVALEGDKELDAQIEALLTADPVLCRFIESLTHSQLRRWIAGDERVEIEYAAMHPEDGPCLH